MKDNEMPRHVVRVQERLGAYRILVGKPKEMRTLENLGLGGMVIISGKL